MSSRKIPKSYIPSSLSKRDTKKQRKSINRSRKNYSKGSYINRPHLDSFISKSSPHVVRAKNMYGVSSMNPTSTLVRATGCKKWALKKIIEKGEGAYYSSGSRPNQSAQGWGYARLGSSLTGGPASGIDYDILKRGCSKNSIALKHAIEK
jgi:hypothetical protein